LKYNKYYFLSNVREKDDKSSLLFRKVKRCLKGISNFLMSHVLLILDDIGHDDQLEVGLPLKVKVILKLDSLI